MRLRLSRLQNSEQADAHCTTAGSCRLLSFDGMMNLEIFGDGRTVVREAVQR